MYRLYNPYLGEHLYTSSQSEISNLTANWGWRLEGPAWVAPAEGSAEAAEPVFRLYNLVSGEHLYTRSGAEAAALDAMADWRLEGTAFWSAGPDGVPVCRLYNPGLRFSHHYTASEPEWSMLVASWGWRMEGVSWYGLKQG